MNTKRTAAVFLCACMVFAFITGCKPITQHGTTLQGTIFNAITGERIGGNDLKMYLEQGTITRTPDVLYTGKKKLFNRDNSTTMSQDLMGDYAFSNIPSMDNDTTDNNPNEYRVSVIKNGFQRFEGIIDSDMLANKDNVIRNIYLFPVDFEIPCYTYTAKAGFNGKPVPGAIITLSPYATFNPGILATDKWLSTDLGSTLEEGLVIIPSPPAPPILSTLAPLVGNVLDVFTLFNNNYFFPAPGYLANISEETNAAGQVSFCDGLATGAAYAVCIDIPDAFEGVQLSRECKILIPGISDANQLFTLDTLGSSGNDYDLAVSAISNSVSDQVVDNGTLTIKFNKAVTFTGAFGATPTSVAGVLDAAAPVTAVLSEDGLTLTLTPKWTTQPGADETNAFITYTNGTAVLSVKGYPGSEINLFNCTGSSYVYYDGNCVSGTVQIRK